MSSTLLPEPALEGRIESMDPQFRFVADPTSTISLAFSKNLERASAEQPSNIALSVLVPNVGWEPVEVTAANVVGSRRLVLTLASRTRFDGLHRVRASNIRDSTDLTTLPTTTSYFVTRVGVWGPPEVLAFGEGALSGGVTVNDNLGLTQVIEAQFFDVFGSNTFYNWTASVSTARFGEAWLAPRSVWHSPSSTDPNENQMSTGGINTTSDLAFFNFQDGHLNVTQSTIGTRVVRVRTPIAVIDTLSDFEFGEVRGAEVPDAGVMDLHGPNALSLENPHLSFRARVAGEGNRLAGAWWALTDVGVNTVDPVDPNRPLDLTYTRQGVYANAIEVNGAPMRWDSYDWGPATLLSTGSDHASWPFVAELDDTRVVVIWWTADTRTDLLSPTLGASGAYRMSVHPAVGTAGADWGAEQIIATGDLLPITQVVDLSGGRVLVFTRGASGPVAQILDVAAGTLGAPSMPLAPASFPAGFDIPIVYNPSQPFNASVNLWRARMNRTAPFGTRLSTDMFIVRWDSRAATMGDPNDQLLARLDASGTTLTWGEGPASEPVVDFTSFNTEPSSLGSFTIQADSLGWVTLMWPDRINDMESLVRTRRANLLVETLESLRDSPMGPMPGSRDSVLNGSLPGTFARFPSLTNTHISGVVAGTWEFGIGFISGQFVRGALISRFE